MESNPQLIQIVPPNEVVVLISFELSLGDIRGMINLCIPFNSIERIGGKLTSNSWASYGKSGADEDASQQIADLLDHSQVELRVTLAETRITMSDLIGLRVGDIVTTDHDINEALTVNVQDTPKFRAAPGALKGKKAIQIQGLIDS